MKTLFSMGTCFTCNVILPVAPNSICKYCAGIWAKQCTFSDNFPTCAISLTKNMLTQRHSLTLKNGTHSPCLNLLGYTSWLYVHCTFRNDLWASELELFTSLWLLPFYPRCVVVMPQMSTDETTTVPNWLVVGACLSHYSCCQKCQPLNWCCFCLDHVW